MVFNQKELVLLPYPFTDQKGSKVRPAVIISNNQFNVRCEDCVMVPLTTIIKTEPYSFVIQQKDLEKGNLLKSSRVRIDKLFTVNKSLILMKIGKINDKTFLKIKNEVFRIF
ncbi:MAG: type II toxin-antitoxin system PemK/MazF family toxin [Nanoarchaeota archaeon]|nr:type II toxin-antitoxin system PemK/MazF family toxin [Nanoarchaeota archaeon]